MVRTRIQPPGCRRDDAARVALAVRCRLVGKGDSVCVLSGRPDVGFEPLDGLSNASLELDFCLETEKLLRTRRVEHPSHLSVGPFGVPLDGSVEPDDTGHGAGQVTDRDLSAGAD